MKVSRVLGNIKGQTLVEFALIVTLLLALLFGITEFGRGWYYSNAVTNAARAGARFASEKPIGASGLGTSPPGINVINYTFGQVTSMIPAVQNGNPAVFVNISTYDKNGNPVGPIPTAADNSPNGPKGDAVTVIVRYNFDVLTGSIIPFFSGQKQLVRKATMYYEIGS